MTPYHIEQEALCVTAKWRARRPTWGHQRTFHDVRVASALPPKADIAERYSHVSFGPNSGHWPSLFDHLVGDREHARWNSETESFSGLEIDDEFEIAFLQHRQFGQLLAL